MQARRFTDGLHLRGTVLVIATVETGLWLVLVWSGIAAEEPATRGLDRGLAVFGSAVYLAAGATALVLAARGRRLRLALCLALLPIAACVGLIVAFGSGG